MQGNIFGKFICLDCNLRYLDGFNCLFLSLNKNTYVSTRSMSEKSVVVFTLAGDINNKPANDVTINLEHVPNINDLYYYLVKYLENLEFI